MDEGMACPIERAEKLELFLKGKPASRNRAPRAACRAEFKLSNIQLMGNQVERWASRRPASACTTAGHHPENHSDLRNA
jgi:hypothetical protein